jgi:hypothetical protein
LARMPIVLTSLLPFFSLCVTQGAACASWRREWDWSQIFFLCDYSKFSRERICCLSIQIFKEECLLRASSIS